MLLLPLRRGVVLTLLTGAAIGVAIASRRNRRPLTGTVVPGAGVAMGAGVATEAGSAAGSTARQPSR